MRSPELVDNKQKIREFIFENFLLEPGATLQDDDSLLQLQIVDSTGFLELVNFLEDTFGVAVADEEMVPENLETVANIEKFIAHKLKG